MTEESKSSSQNNIEIKVDTYNESKANIIGKLETEKAEFNAPVTFLVENEPLLERLESIGQTQSVGVLKTGDIPKSLAHWQGRKEEIEQLRHWLGDKNVSLMGIEGIGGTGKSMLATKIYEEIEGFPKRFWADVSSGAILFSDLARRLLTKFEYGVPQEEKEFVNALVRCLRSGQYLLVVDNLESLLESDRQWKSPSYEEFFRTWIEYGGGSTILVTTRERPTLKEFNRWLSLQGLKPKEGAALLRELGIQGEVEAFAKLVDGHPLLLKIVADLIKDEYPKNPSLERLQDLELGNLQQLLTDPMVVCQHRLEKEVGLDWVLDASFNRLQEWQRQWLQNLSVYRGAFDGEAAIQMFPLSDKENVEQQLRKLAKRSLVEEPADGRFSFQPVVLEYIRYKAVDQTEAHRQAIEYYTKHQKDSGYTIDDVKEFLEIFYHWVQLEEYDTAFDTVRTVDEFLTMRGYYTVHVELYEQLVATWQQTDARENWKYADSLTDLGDTYNSLGQYQKAIKFLQQSLKIAQEIGDKKGEANSLNGLGNAYDSLGQYQKAINYCQQSLKIKREIGNRNGEANSLISLGDTYNSLRQYQKAIKFLQQSLKITQEIGYKNGEATSLNNLGNTYFIQGKYQQAIKYYQQSLALRRTIGDRNGEASSLSNLGVAYKSLRQYQKAIKFLQQSVEIYQEIGDKNGEAISLGNLGNTYRSQGKYREAIKFHQQSLEIRQKTRNRNEEVNSWFNLGLTFAQLQQKSEALKAFYHARQLYQAMGLDRDVQDCDKQIEKLSQEDRE